MENNELQKIWRSFDTEINQKSKDELKLLLTSKTKQTIGKILVTMSISILICIGLLIYLTITSLNRQNDLIYLINNAMLGIVTIISLVSGVLSWYKLQNNRYNQPLKNWLEDRINLLTKWLTGRFSRLYLFLIPFLYVLIVLSIHVYFENKSFVAVLNTEESIIGLIAGIPIGLFVSYFGARKIRKYQLNNLEFLKDLHSRLCNVR
jgi:competence protein ComGC